MAGSLCFALFLAELPALLRLVDYRAAIGHNADWWPKNYVSDPELIHIRRPDSHLTGSTKGGLVTLYYRVPSSGLTAYRWDVAYDSDGFRNARNLTQADIAMIGDSYVEGMTVLREDLVTTRLEALTGKTVANLGQPGYGPQQELIVMKRYGLKFHPLRFVWMFYEGNDLLDVQNYDRFQHRTPGFWRDAVARSFTKNALQLVYQYLLPPAAEVSGVAHGRDGNTVEYFTAVDSFSTRQLTDADRNAITETARIVQTAAGLASAQGGKFLFVYIPDKFRVMRDSMEFPVNSQCRAWTVNDLPARVKDAVTRAAPDIEYLDLTPELQQAARNGVLTYFADDPHWNPEGHRVGAEAIAHAVRTSGR